MELMPGYKQSEVGPIPSDWDLLPVSELANVDPENLSASTDPNYSFNYISLEQVDFGNLIGTSREVFRTAPSRARRIVRHDDVLMSTVRPNLKAHLHFRSQVSDAICSTGFAVLRAKPDAADPAYIFAHLFASPVNKQIEKTLAGSNYPAINSRDVRELKIPCPPTLREQGVIAQALSDVDALLATLDQMIAKKRDLKQAAMQQLLTGKTRLPGFFGEWQKKPLGELGATYGGLTGKTKSDFGVGTAKYITFMNVMTNTVIDCAACEQVNVSASETQNRVMRGDLIFNGSSETPEEVAFCSLMAEEVPNLYLNSFCFGFRLFDDQQVGGLFLTYYIRANPGREMMKSLAQGSTRYNLSKTALCEASVLLPMKEEQAAIAEVLSGMDAELIALETRRDKTRNIKQAMMQELLTGKTRLV